MAPWRESNGSSRDFGIARAFIRTTQRRHSTDTNGNVILCFAGLDPVNHNVGRGLYKKWIPFHETVNRCSEHYRSLRGRSLFDVGLFGQHKTEEYPDYGVLMTHIFAIQAGLAATLRAAGLKVTAVAGFSAGEACAAHVSGSIPQLETALAAQVAMGEGYQAALRIVGDNVRYKGLILSGKKLEEMWQDADASGLCAVGILCNELACFVGKCEEKSLRWFDSFMFRR